MEKTHKFYWRAIYKDGNISEQFREDNSERLFKDLRFDDIVAFELISNSYTKIKRFGLTIDSGLFYINDIPINFVPEYSWRKDTKRKLIYFYRNWIITSEHSKALSKLSSPVIGYEINDNGKIYNYMFMISPDGNEVQRVLKK